MDLTTIKRGRELEHAAVERVAALDDGRRRREAKNDAWFTIRLADDPDEDDPVEPDPDDDDEEEPAPKKGSSATIYVYDEISMWGITADDFVRQVAALDVDTIDLRLNSPGGLVFDGIAIHNTLVEHRAEVNVVVDGVAASIASIIAMAGDSVTMGRGTEMMIHNPRGLAIGEARDMRAYAEMLDKIAEDMAGFYMARAGGSLSEWLGRMNDETWYGAQEAVDAGLADAVSPPPKGRKPKNNVRTHDLRAMGYRYAGRRLAPRPDGTANKSNAIKAREAARREGK